jgi:3-phosphoshikimate 1-carboxyvinyltransferase
LRRLGIRADGEADGFVVHPGPPHAGTVTTYDDHRIAMIFDLLWLVHDGI